MTTRHEWAHGWWEMFEMSPHATLAAVVQGNYCGWMERTTRPVARLETASTVVPLIFNFGPPYRIASPGRAPESGETHHSFVAGLYDSWVTVESQCISLALQVNLTPLGARRVLHCDMSELVGRTVDVRDVLGADGQRITEAMGNCASWAARCALLDAFLRRRVQHDVRIPHEVRAAWTLLEERRGNVRIRELTDTTGWSAKRLIAAFRTHLGLPPKSLARVMRFESVIAEVNTQAVTPSGVDWTRRALESGYFDQSHLIRDFTQFAGISPSAYLRGRLPAGGGVVQPTM